MKIKNLIKVFSLVICLFSVHMNAQDIQIEKLNRGVVAVKCESTAGVFVSWRSLATDAKKTSFDLYRDGVKVNEAPIATKTNYLDEAGTVSSKYVVKTIVNNEVVEISEEVPVWAGIYKKIHLEKPADGVTKAYHVTNTVSGEKVDENYPEGQPYSYTPNDCSVGDVDGDGEYEIIVKWDPSNSRDNSYYGVTGNVYLDCYKLDGTKLWRIDLGQNIRAGAHYTQFMVYDLDGDGKAEVACKTAPGTKDGKNNYVLMGKDDPKKDHRNSKGYILDGPEYLTVFNGETGEEITTVAYEPGRGSVSSWGDSYGNRVDRFLACIAYLDGKKPSLVMCRGYYTRSALVAYDFDGKKLTKKWIHDSATSGEGAYGQGNHNLSVADVDGDGFDEIIYGACAIDHDGKLLYRTGLGHGDAIHLSDLDPDVEGLEVFCPHEEKSAKYGFEMHDAATGEIVFGQKTGTDVGRGIAADIDANYRGFEMWSTANKNIYDCKGNVIASSNRPSVNFRIYWDGDLQDELLDGTKLDKWNGKKAERLLTLYNYSQAESCNSTKATPNLSADILGDWREEVILYDKSTGSDLLLFTTTIPTEYKVTTLMHDHVYRMGIAWQNVAYNQPPHLGYYLADLDTENAWFAKKGVGALSQSVELGEAIEPIIYSWANAENVQIEGLPEGVKGEIDKDNQQFTISGTPEKTGVYDYTVTSIGGLTTATLKGTIRVKAEVVLTAIASFAFDETSGENAVNSISGNAVAVNFTPEWITGVKGNAIHFPASPADRRMAQAHYDELSLGKEDFTVSLWFRSKGGNGVDWYLFHKGSHKKDDANGHTGKWVGLQYKNEKLTFGIDDDVTKSNIDVAASDYFNNQWTNVICVRDTESKMLQIYINGVLAGETTDNTGDISEKEDLVLGNCNVNFNTPFEGDMDDLVIYKGAMSAAKVKDYYLANVPSSISSPMQTAGVEVYPTRIKEQVTVGFAGSNCDNEEVRISIYSITGTMVYQGNYNIDGDENITISGLGELPAGIYTLSIESSKGKVTRKLLK